MNALWFIHLIAVGIWAGSIATEAVFEITLDQAPAQANGSALPHIRIARFLAIPAILTALFTGIAMLRLVAWDAFLVAKVTLAASAVVLHVAGAVIARRQRRCLDARDMGCLDRLGRWHDRFGIGCMVSLAGAAAIGGLRVAV